MYTHTVSTHPHTHIHMLILYPFWQRTVLLPVLNKKRSKQAKVEGSLLGDPGCNPEVCPSAPSTKIPSLSRSSSSFTFCCCLIFPKHPSRTGWLEWLDERIEIQRPEASICGNELDFVNTREKSLRSSIQHIIIIPFSLSLCLSLSLTHTLAPFYSLSLSFCSSSPSQKWNRIGKDPAIERKERK